MVYFTKAQKEYLVDVISTSLKYLEKSWEKQFKGRERTICERVRKTLLGLPEES